MQKKQIKKYYNLLREFGFRIAFNEFKLRVFGRIFGRNSYIWKKSSRKKYDTLDKVLKNEFSDIIDKYRDSNEGNYKIDSNAPIWIFWAQGFDNAPEVVKLCVKSIKKHAGSHPVILLDDNNYSQYVSINQNTIKMYRDGVYSIVHFSDILRFNLLAQKGGIWCDATLFLMDEIEKNNPCDLSFFSIKHNIGSDYLACRGLWTSFCLGFGTNSVMAKCVSECFDKYWEEHKYIIDYLLVDCIMYAVYDSLQSVKMKVDSLPVNNEYVFEAMYSFERMDDPSVIKKLLKQQGIHKLTYKVLHGKQESELMELVLTSLLSETN